MAVNINNKTIFLIIGLMLIGISKAQTTIPPGSISGTWTKSSSPYKVTGDVTVLKDSTLIIEPGTVVEFQDNYGIKVDGIIRAEGKLGDSIVFKATINKIWGGIHFVKNTSIDTFKFNYCRFENIGDGFKFGYKQFAVCARYSSSIKVSNCSFYYFYNNDNEGGSIYCRKGNVFVENVLAFTKAKTRNTSFVFLDTAYFFHIKKATTFFPLSLINPMCDFLITECKSNYGLLEDISNYAKTSIYFSLGYSNNIICNRLDLRDKITFNIGNLRNSKILNSSFENSNTTSIKTINNCTGTIFENCEIRNCGSNTIQTKSCMDIQSSGPLFKNCKITENNWGVYISQKYGAGTPVFLNTEIIKNKYVPASIEGYPVFINCNIQDNSTFYQSPSPYDTFTVPPYSGGLLLVTEFYPTRPYFYNCILWGNRDSLGNRASLGFFSNNSNVRADLFNCILQGDTSTGIGGFDDNTYKKFKVNPAYINYVRSNGIPPGFKDSTSGDYTLTNTCSQTAYAINRGLSGNLLTQYPFSMLKSQYGIDIYNSTDLAGNARVMDDTIDIGCYESSGTKKALTLRGSYQDSIVCYGGSNTYDSKSYGTIQNYQWQKKQNNVISIISTQNNLKLSNQRTDGIQYRLKVSNTECTQLSDSSNWFTIKVNNPIKKGITKNPNRDTIQLKETMLLSTGSTGYNSFAWSNGASASSTSFKGSDLGSLGAHQITLEARNINGCLETDTVYIYTKANSSIHQSLTQAGIKLYPSPAITILNIECNEPLTIEIYDLNGQLLFSQNTESNTSQLNIEELKQGVYFVKLRKGNNDELVVKLIKD